MSGHPISFADNTSRLSAESDTEQASLHAQITADHSPEGHSP